MPAFEDWLVVAAPRLARSAFLLTGDHGTAADLVQHACLEVWPRFGRIDNPDAYARQVMVRTAASWWRRRWRGELPHATLPDLPETADDERVESRLLLAAALRQLTPRQRAVIVLRYYEDLSEREVANVLKMPIGTVRSTTARALTALRASTTLDPAATREVGR